MPRLSHKQDVLRALFARSGNRCAFPGCTAVLVNEKNQFVAQICHINAAEPGGERFDACQSDETRRSYDNLLILCYPHHVETDDVDAFPAEVLRSMKSDHEADFGRKVYKINESLLYKIASEMEAFWQKAERLHQQHQAMSDLALEIEVNAIYAELADAAHLSVKDILSLRDMLIGNDDAMGRYIASLRSALLSGGVALIDEHPKTSGPNNFELLNLGITNTATKLSVLLVQMELRFLEAHLKLNPLDAASRSRLDKAKARFSELAASAGYVD